MKNQSAKNNGSRANSGYTHNNRLLPNSLKFISSCLKTVSTNVKSAGASVAASISGDYDEHKDQVLCASFDRLELGPSVFKCVLLLGYNDGFQVLDVEDASHVRELLSKRDDPVTFLQIQPIPAKSEGCEGFGRSHPLLLVVASDETKNSSHMQAQRDGLTTNCYSETQTGNLVHSPTAVRFYSLRTHNYVHVLRFRSTVYMVRCSPRVVAVGLATQIYCFNALTLENKFSVLTYPVPQMGGQGITGVNNGYGPMAVGPRWLAYASNSQVLSNTSRLSPQSLTPSPGVSPSTSPGNGSLVARYAMESSKQLAAGLVNLGDVGYKTLSKYCQEFISDGPSSPISSTSSPKIGRITQHSTEMDTAGMVVVKDFVSRAVVSQFRAHSSPISALCFDPSGMLLVTASVHGNNINIFRIMPACSQTGSGTQTYDWSLSHVHLYKLRRGMTSAVIQDICFSHYSQWIAIVSSRGTCHIFVLSPFGGDTGIVVQNSHADHPILLPSLSHPWWSSSSSMIGHHFLPRSPPPTITLSVISRTRSAHSGWLNTVSTVAAGKASVPSGAIAVVFHNSVHSSRASNLTVNVLEHLLAYTPCGHLAQYELLPSFEGESHETDSRMGTGSGTQLQDDDLKVKVHPAQWWDVLRRTHWPEREECISGVSVGRPVNSDAAMDAFDREDNDCEEKDWVKSHEHFRWYLSNAEVQINSGRVPVWQRTQICFYAMTAVEASEQSLDQSGGEIEIEKIHIQEVEIRRKDLLPVYNNFHGMQSNWDHSDFSGDKDLKSLPEPRGAFKSIDAVNSQSKLGSDDSPKISDNGSVTRVEAVFNVDRTAGTKSDSLEPSKICISPVQDNNKYIISKLSSSMTGPLSCAERDVKEVQAINSAGTSDISNTSSNRSDVSMNSLDEGLARDALDFGQYFQEEYCRPSDVNQAADDIDGSNSSCGGAKAEENGDNDGMPEAVFSFSEEG